MQMPITVKKALTRGATAPLEIWEMFNKYVRDIMGIAPVVVGGVGTIGVGG